MQKNKKQDNQQVIVPIRRVIKLLKDGLNAEKSFRCTKLSPTEDMARIMDPLASEPETPSPSNAPTSYGFESQPKLETDNMPSTSGTAKSCSFKLGVCSSRFLPLCFGFTSSVACGPVFTCWACI